MSEMPDIDQEHADKQAMAAQIRGLQLELDAVRNQLKKAEADAAFWKKEEEQAVTRLDFLSDKHDELLSKLIRMIKE